MKYKVDKITCVNIYITLNLPAVALYTKATLHSNSTGYHATFKKIISPRHPRIVLRSILLLIGY